MTAVTWDEVGTRFYETGIDRCVLYVNGGTAVAWNGLTSINENSAGGAVNPVYFDGVKVTDEIIPGDFSGTLTAYTYPDEFFECEGLQSVGNGLYAADQKPTRFGLTYRTMIGSDTEGDTQDYKIHVLYNLVAVPSAKSRQSMTETTDPIEFEWTITGVPAEVPGLRPSVHLIFDTRQMSPLLISDIENTLYGNPINDGELPSMSTLTSFVGAWVIIRITDNLDGTWTAEGPDDLITMLDATTFQIIQANAEFLDSNTYMISDTTY